jgi:hypothetical protein
MTVSIKRTLIDIQSNLADKLLKGVTVVDNLDEKNKLEVNVRDVLG